MTLFNKAEVVADTFSAGRREGLEKPTTSIQNSHEIRLRVVVLRYLAVKL